MTEKARERGGCRKAAVWTGLGCLAIPVLGLLFAAFSLGWGFLFYNHEGPMRQETTTVTVSRGDGPGDGAAQEGIRPGVDFEQLQQQQAGGRRPVRLVLDLEEGEFDIRPGPPGSEIKAEGRFDPRDYELSQQTEEGGGEYDSEITIRFRRKVPLLFFLLRGGFDNQEHLNKITVRIPEDLPTALELRLSKGESNTDLGGLSLTELQANLTMGEHDLSVSRPIRGELEQADLSMSMGEVTVVRLGNIRARRLEIRGRMGEVRADMDGDWPAGFATRVDVSFSMGEFRLSVPRSVRIDPGSSASMFLGESYSGALHEEGPSDPDAPVLEIHASAKMGEFRVTRD